jgi:hypothetical protein
VGIQSAEREIARSDTGLSGGSIPFRGVGVGVCWSSCGGGDWGGTVFWEWVLER